MLDQDGLLDHARLRLLDDPHLYLLLRHGGVHLLTRLHGLLGLLLRLGSFLSFLFVVLDLLLLSVDDNLSNHDIEGHSDSDLDSESDVKNGLVCITRSARKIVTVIDIFQENDKDDEQNEADDQLDDFDPEHDDDARAELDTVGPGDNTDARNAEHDGVNA